MEISEKKLSRYQKLLIDELDYKDIDLALLNAIDQYITEIDSSIKYSKVACSREQELEDIKTSFLVELLGIEDSESLMKSIKEVCSEIGSANRNKYRAAFYYHLLVKLKAQDIFLDKRSSTDEENKSAERSPNRVINKHARYAALIGLVPLPLLDLAGISAIQYKMIKELSKAFPQMDKEPTTDKVIASIVGGLASLELGFLTRSIFKSIPIVGSVVSSTAVSAYAYFSTKIIGEIFEEHFMTGGDLSIDTITFNKMKARYNDAIRGIKFGQT